MFYIFKQAYDWEGIRTIDESAPSRIIRAKNPAHARKKLPVRAGKEWVLVGTTKKKK